MPPFCFSVLHTSSATTRASEKPQSDAAGSAAAKAAKGRCRADSEARGSGAVAAGQVLGRQHISSGFFCFGELKRKDVQHA